VWRPRPELASSIWGTSAVSQQAPAQKSYAVGLENSCPGGACYWAPEIPQSDDMSHDLVKGSSPKRVTGAAKKWPTLLATAESREEARRQTSPGQIFPCRLRATGVRSAGLSTTAATVVRKIRGCDQGRWLQIATTHRPAAQKITTVRSDSTSICVPVTREST
jgi:hypothetical protein